MFGDEVFDHLTDPGFKLVIFSSFKKNQILGEVLFEMLHDISKKEGYNNFEYYLRKTGGEDKIKWDEAYFKENLKLQEIKQVYVYGPLGAEESLKEILKKIGVQEQSFKKI